MRVTMNCDGRASTPAGCLLNNKKFRNSRRRHRHRLRRLNFRVQTRYQTRFQTGCQARYPPRYQTRSQTRSQCGNRTNFSPSSFPLQTNDLPFVDSCGVDDLGIMSNWYWSNYKKAIEWQDKHKIAHWKACALALQEENRHLLQIINNMQPGLCPKVPVTSQSLGEKFCINKMNTKSESLNVNVNNANKLDDHKDNSSSNENDNYEDENDEFQFEMSEEMIQFFEKSMKHKLDLENLKKERKQLNDAEEEIKQMQTSRLKRSSEMQSLYGEQASMITGMETAVQLSFEKYCDTKSPKYWPNIPFRL